MKLIIVLLISFQIFAVDNAQVEKMVEQFQAKGLLKDKDVSEAKARLQQITPEQWKAINQMAGQYGGKYREPANNDLDEAAQRIDTEGADFKDITKKLEMILKN